MKNHPNPDDNKSVRKIILSTALITFFIVIPSVSISAWPEDKDYGFPENYEIRMQLREIITAPTGDVLNSREKNYPQQSGRSRVKYDIKTQNDSFYMLFINEKDYRYPVYSSGTYIIRRNLDDGKFSQIKVFLKNDSECFVRIYPDNDRAVLELNIYGKQIYSGINLPYSFSDVLVLPFADIIKATAGIIDWDLIFPDRYSISSDSKMILLDEIRSELPKLSDEDDGALDADGEFRFIENLQVMDTPGFNCSGFVKWVADGIYAGLTGKYMGIRELKEKFLDLRGNRWSARYESERDPYFGLDWTRNIATEIRSEWKHEESGYESADVTNVPWADYVEDIGFPIGELETIMYYLAVTEPSTLYLASVNIPWGEGPVLRQHVHTAVLLPSIKNRDDFDDVILERNFESNTESLEKRYPGAYVHLVRIEVPPVIKLPQLVNEEGLGDHNLFRR